MKKIKNIGWEVEELNQTQEELLEQLKLVADEMGLGDSNELLRVQRIIKNKFGWCRSVVRSQNFLEKNGHIEVVK